MNPPTGEVKAVGRGRGPWRQDQSTIELRRPQNVPSPHSSGASTSSIASGDAGTSIDDSLRVALQSKLSVNAKEFVPRGFVPTNNTSDSEAYDSASISGSSSQRQQDDSIDESFDSSQEWAFQHLSDVIRSLSANPGQFDHVVQPLLEELTPLLAEEKAVENIVVMIINGAVADRNFRYSGARLCNTLNNHQQPGVNALFRRVLLNKLSEEHERIESNLESNPERVYGFVHFLGELYIQLELARGLGNRIAVLGDALVLALKLLIQIPIPDRIKHTCDVLKLAGRLLDTDQPDEMDNFFNDFKKLKDDDHAGPRVKTLITCILKLRQDNWGHAASSEHSASSSASSMNEAMSSAWSNDGIYYGPDHQALTAEEYKFLNDNCKEDEALSVGDDIADFDPDGDENENAEIMSAFREFVNQKPRS